MYLLWEQYRDLKGCEICLVSKVKLSGEYAKRNLIKMREYRQRIRKEVIEKYGGKCECCGESNIEFLVIDHKNNDGNIERRKLNGTNKSGGSKFFLKLKRELLRVLCFNCNSAIAFHGYCPHKGRPVLEKLFILNEKEIELINLINVK
jgi:hypothetical protein